MDETKICPFCGEEILAVAKKCKHCGEWLEDAPITKRIGLFKNADYTGMLPVATILFGLNAWLGIMAPLTIIFLLLWGFSTIFIPWIISLAIAATIVWTGLKRSKSLTSPTETVTTLRTWLSLQTAFAWWPANLIICLLLGMTGIFSENYGYLGGYAEYPVYMIITWILMIASGIFVYIRYKRKTDITAKEIAKPFVIWTLSETALIILYMYILKYQVGYILPQFY